jgi:hypothetical protein
MANEIRVPQLRFTGDSLTKGWIQVSVTPTANSLLGFNASSVPANVTIGSGLALAGNVLSATNSGSVTSVGLSMPTGFSVANSPVTSTGTLAVTTTLNGIIYGDGANALAAVTIGSGLSFAGGTLTATGAGGTVTSVSVVTANGVSGSVATATTTPAITLTLGAITPTTVNGLTITTTTGALTVAAGKTLTVNNTLTLAGTDGSTLNVGAGGTLGTAAFTATSAYEVPLTFSTGLTRSTNTITVNASQNIATLSNLTSNGIVTTSGGTGALSITATTGSGSVVLATSPTLVTPALGTPSAIVLTNATGLPIGGLTGLGTGVATALGNTTNASGGLVTFSGNIGAASGTTLTLSGLLTSGSLVTGTWQATNGTIINGSANSFMSLQSAAGFELGFYMLRTGSFPRWSISTNNTAEGGSNAGSDFELRRYDDAGSSLGLSLAIDRSSGIVTLANIVTIATDGDIGGVVDLTMGGTLTVNTVNATTFNFTTFGTGVVPGANGGTGIANTGKTITLGASLTTTGTDLPTFAFPSAATARTYTFPTTTATLARTDAANTFTGASTASAWVLTSPTITTGIVPTTNDGAALGSTSNQFSDLFLAEGGVINWDNGDATITQSGNTLTIAGAELIIDAASGPTSTVAAGFRGIPQNSQSAAYTTVLADAGKHLLHPSADTTARTFTIDSNANVAYPIGTAITIVNQNSAGVVTIAITSDTMRLAGAGTTGSRTLAANGVATAIKITSTEWIISGTGLT